MEPESAASGNTWAIQGNNWLKTDYILFGKREVKFSEPLSLLLESCTDKERTYAEQLLKTFLIAMNSREDDPENPLTEEDASSEDESLS